MIIIATSILLSLVICLLDHSFGKEAIDSFCKGESIGIMGTMVSINCGAIANLYFKIVETEKDIGESLYPYVKQQLKHNSIFSIGAFVFIVMFMLISKIFIETMWIQHVYHWLNLSIFFLECYALYETAIRFMMSIK